jgi:hypothetical protein
VRQIADSSRSPVRTRTTVSTGLTQTLPSPMRPVCAAFAMIPTTSSASASSVTISIRILGTRAMSYSAPR